ncbi:MAG: uracil-DNA glycosylase [Hyphomicrobium sp.]
MTDAAYSMEHLLALLDWQRAMGADAALGDMPVDWLAHDAGPGAHFAWPERAAEPAAAFTATAGATTGAAPLAPRAANVAPPQRDASAAPPSAARAQPTSPVPTRAQTPLSASTAETEARAIARGVTSLDTLQTALAGFEGCALKATAKNLVFYRGAKTARLMLIGEAPGRDEDIAGKPFVGRAGQLLDKMLAAIGLSETDVHITNIVYWRPPGNRTPTPQESLACRPFLEKQVDLVAPDLVVALGGSAAKDVLQTADGIMRLRGKWREITIGARTVSAMATLHPAYLLRSPAAKMLAWQDLMSIRKRLDARTD